MKTRIRRCVLALGLCSMAIQNLGAQTQPGLTVWGAEQAGSADGTIPPYTGGLTKAPAGFDPTQGWADPFAAEKPLLVIDARNADQYAEQLTPGQLALFKRYSNYKIQVYPTHRTAAFSDAMQKAVREESGQIKLVAEGRGLAGVKNSPVPFPTPKTGLEVIWNTLLRRPAHSLSTQSASFIASGGQTQLAPVSTAQTIAFAPALGMAGSQVLFNLIGEVKRPASQAGEAALVQEPLNFKDDTRNAWIVNAGQRRVLRAPELSHAAPAGNTDALRTVDDVYGFNGSPERFDWVLLGKRELFIPYNNYRLSNKRFKYDQLLDGVFLKPELTRFERHRVWVVEGRLKAGQDHIYSRRVLYIDEDSWYVALMDQYDLKGELWRTKALYLLQAYQVPGMFSAGEMQHDFNARKTAFAGFQNEEPASQFNVPVQPADFTPAALRKLMR